MTKRNPESRHNMLREEHVVNILKRDIVCVRFSVLFDTVNQAVQIVN